MMAKRFIAGAVCPKCDQMDKIYVEAESQVAKCAACGYELQQPEESSDQELENTSEDTGESAVTLVNFKTDPTKKSD